MNREEHMHHPKMSPLLGYRERMKLRETILCVAQFPGASLPG